MFRRCSTRVSDRLSCRLRLEALRLKVSITNRLLGILCTALSSLKSSGARCRFLSAAAMLSGRAVCAEIELAVQPPRRLVGDQPQRMTAIRCVLRFQPVETDAGK